MRIDVAKDWQWSDLYLREVRRVLMLNARFFVDFQVADYERDVKYATDITVNVDSEIAIAVRLRRPLYNFRDLTIRAERTSGAQTELEKLRAGYGDFYLYGWVQGQYIHEWMLVDLHRLRSTLLFYKDWPIRRNTDHQTAFIAIPYHDLRQAGCVLAAEIQTRPNSNDVFRRRNY